MGTIRCQFCGAILDESAWNCECGASAYVDWGWRYDKEKPSGRFFSVIFLALASGITTPNGFWWWCIQIAILVLFVTARNKIRKLVTYKKKRWQPKPAPYSYEPVVLHIRRW